MRVYSDATQLSSIQFDVELGWVELRRYKRALSWEGFVEKVGFEAGVKEWWMMRVVVIIEMSWQVNEEVSRDMTGEADGMNQGVNSGDGVWRHSLPWTWFEDSIWSCLSQTFPYDNPAAFPAEEQ